MRVQGKKPLAHCSPARLPPAHLCRRRLRWRPQHTLAAGHCPLLTQRSWIALVEKGLPFEIQEVNLQNKSEEFKAEYASIHPDPEAPAKVWPHSAQSGMQLGDAVQRLLQRGGGSCRGSRIPAPQASCCLDGLCARAQLAPEMACAPRCLSSLTATPS